jgi:hypothetical protein
MATSLNDALILKLNDKNIASIFKWKKFYTNGLTNFKSNTRLGRIIKSSLISAAVVHNPEKNIGKNGNNVLEKKNNHNFLKNTINLFLVKRKSGQQ